MLQIEEARYGEASMAQVDQFITEEFSGTGGKLSDGSVLLSEATAYGDGKGGWEIPAYQMSRMRNEVSYYGSFVQNHNNFVGKSSFYSYKYFRERSWQQRDGSFPGLSLTSFAAGQASAFLSNSKTWFNLSNMTTYSQKYFGNQWEAAKVVSKNKGIAKKWSSRIGVAGKIIGIYGAYNTVQEYESGKLSTFGAAYILGADAAGVFGGTFGSAWSLGTYLGKSIVESDLYFNAVHRKKIW